MKTVKTKDGEILRLKDDKAEQLVLKQNAVYIAKSEWKKEVRDKGL